MKQKRGDGGERLRSRLAKIERQILILIAWKMCVKNEYSTRQVHLTSQTRQTTVDVPLHQSCAENCQNVTQQLK